jgi:hypothetical protein
MDQGRTDVVEFLEKAGPPGSFRVLPLSEFQNNRFAGFAVASIGGYHAAKPRRFQDLVDRHVFENPYWLRLLNVRYILSPQPLEIPRFRAVYQGAEDPRFPDRYVFENPDALPRATLLHAYRVAPSEPAILDSISAGLYDPARVTWLESDPHLALGASAADSERAEIVRYRLNDVSIDVQTPTPALLRLADLWYPDWVARVDGRPTPILRADYLLRAVPVPAGRHAIEFQFESPAVRRGFTLSLVCFAASLALLLAGWLTRRRGPALREAA